MTLENDSKLRLLKSNIDAKEKNAILTTSIANEIIEAKKIISKIIITTRVKKNKLKKLYKKNKKINTALIKFNRNKDKEFLKVISSEINTVYYFHKRIEQKLQKNKNLLTKNKKITLDLDNQNKLLKTKDKILNDFDKKILFYQNENTRLSSKLLLTEKQNKIINENLIITQNKKNELIKLIKDLSDHFLKGNIFKTKFEKPKIELINDHKKISSNKEIKKKNSKDDLNKIVNDIFN